MVDDQGHPGESTPAKGRKDERVTINKEFESYDAFINEYITNISRTGVFVRSKMSRPKLNVTALLSSSCSKCRRTT